MKKMILALIISFLFVGCTLFSDKEASNETHQKIEISTISRIEDSAEWDKSIMTDFGLEPIKGEGFVYESANKKWILEVANKGTVEASGIEVTYKIIAYKNDIEYGIDELDIKSYKPVIYKQKTSTLKIDKLSPGESKSYDVFFMGTYPSADLKIESLVSEGKNVGDPIEYNYQHNEFDQIEDTPHLRKLLGVYKDSTKTSNEPTAD